MRHVSLALIDLRTALRRCRAPRPSQGLLISILVGACTGDDTPDDGSYNCAAETTDDEFVVGLTKAGERGMLDFVLLSADPAPPARGDNTWLLELRTRPAAAPVEGATIEAAPFMPSHQHGSAKPVVVEPMPQAGQYQLSPVNMWMPGVWETTIDVTAAGGSDRAVFRFCLPT